MQSNRTFDACRMIQIAAAVGLASATSCAFAAPGADSVEAQAHQTWKEAVTHASTPGTGCFHAVYPSKSWVKDQCRPATNSHLTPPKRVDSKTGMQTVGNGDDYVVETTGNFSQVVGTFPTVSDVTFERSVGDLIFGDSGILGPNEYTLQLNSQYDLTTAACQGHAGCTIWQQFLYSPDYQVQGTAAVFIQYWLLGWGSTTCPTGFWQDGTDCYTNSDYTAAPDVPITQLGNEKLSASAVSGGNDTTVFTDGNTAYALTASDSMLALATGWDQAEFNIVGNAGGSRADFNPGASVTVNIAETDGTTTAPTCLAGHGSTGETNNLTAGTCSAVGGATPYVQFTQANQVTF
jgi:hypothetical protein